MDFQGKKSGKLLKIWRNKNIIWGYIGVIDENHYNENTYFGLVKAKGDFSSKIDQIIEPDNKISDFYAKIFLDYDKKYRIMEKIF